jgi:putative membrane protein
MLLNLANITTALVAIIHIWIMVLEMFLWTKPYGRKAFGMKLEQAQATAVLAANQGLYNGVLAAGLIWGLWNGVLEIKAFFLISIAVLGIFGAMTASKKIVFVQTIPALLALTLSFLA